MPSGTFATTENVKICLTNRHSGIEMLNRHTTMTLDYFSGEAFWGYLLQLIEPESIVSNIN